MLTKGDHLYLLSSSTWLEIYACSLQIKESLSFEASQMCSRDKVLIMTGPWCLTWNKTKDGLNCKSLGANRFGISVEMYQFSLNLSFSVTVKGIFAINFHGNRTRLLMSFDLVSQSIKWKGLYLFHGHVNALMLALHAESHGFLSRVLLKLIDATHYWAAGQSSF